jgi:hypothetical protein
LRKTNIGRVETTITKGVLVVNFFAPAALCEAGDLGKKNRTFGVTEMTITS